MFFQLINSCSFSLDCSHPSTSLAIINGDKEVDLTASKIEQLELKPKLSARSKDESSGSLST